MDVYLRIGLLVIIAAILSLILFESRNKRRSMRLDKRNADDEIAMPSFSQDDFMSQPIRHTEAMPVKTSQQADKSDFLTMTILAKPPQRFASYDLLQAIFSTGMQFGDMDIFHYYLSSSSEKIPLFSLASATEPGDFDMNRMGDFSCSGLTLFMNIKSVPNAEQAFDLMLQTAEQLAEYLDGELRAGPQHPWTDDVLKTYRSRVKESQFDLSD